MGFIAGGYTVSYGGSTLGQMKNGFEMEEPGTGPSEMVVGDALGPYADQDGVYLPGNCYISCEALDYDAAGLRALVSLYAGSTAGRIGTPGVLLSSQFGSPTVLVLTKVSGTGALPATTRTANRAILAPNFPIRYLMSPRHRTVPIRFQLLPYSSGGNNVHFIDV